MRTAYTISVIFCLAAAFPSIALAKATGCRISNSDRNLQCHQKSLGFVAMLVPKCVACFVFLLSLIVSRKVKLIIFPELVELLECLNQQIRLCCLQIIHDRKFYWNIHFPLPELCSYAPQSCTFCRLIIIQTLRYWDLRYRVKATYLNCITYLNTI